MTAIGGFWSWNSCIEPALACRQITTAQNVYSGDGDAIAEFGAIAIGRGLFAKTFEDRWDRGPVTGGGGRWHMVGSVRLDNRGEVAVALGIDAVTMRTMPDTELVVRAWARWQRDCLPRLLGDYAFAVWDQREEQVVLARDALGGFPLHYHIGSGFLAFASMPKGLHALAEIPRAPDTQRLAEDIALLPHIGSRSFFAGISRVEPGHFVVIKRDQVQAQRHWNPQSGSSLRWKFDDAVDAVRAELDRAVSVRLRGASGTLGAQLSGGMDSAAVVSTAARTFDGSIIAFTSVPRHGFHQASPRGRNNDESRLAALTVARYPNVEHVLVPTQPGATTDDWQRDTSLLDQPVINPCNARWVNAIRAKARDRRVAVMLTGQAGNATLTYGGSELLGELVAAGRLLQAIRESVAIVSHGSMSWKNVVAATLGPWIPASMWRFSERGKPPTTGDRSAFTALPARRAAQMDLEARYRSAGLDPRERTLRTAFAARIQFLRFGDRGNKRMAALGGFRIDERDPTADRRLIELCLSLPTDFYLRAGEPRALGKAVLRDRVPSAVLDDAQRGYQAADWYEAATSARAGLQSDLEHWRGNVAISNVVDLPRMLNLLKSWPDGGWETEAVTTAYRYALLRGAASARFMQQAMGTN